MGLLFAITDRICLDVMNTPALHWRCLLAARLAQFLLIALLSGGSDQGAAARFANPLVAAAVRTGSADPSVVFHGGYYYYCRSVANAKIAVAKARRLQDIGAAPMKVVFEPPAGTAYSRRLWAPELQHVRGRWYIYFAASDGPDANHRMYALEASGSDPQGPYVFKGRVSDTTDGWAIDGVALEIGAELYFVWSGWPEGVDHFPQVIYIARMRDPLRIVGARHAIAEPDLPWERTVAPLLEAPEPLQRDGRTVIVYSANASWSDDSALGLLIYVGGDPLKASSWKKHPDPVFVKNAAAGVFGVGHASFVRSPDGHEDWMLYHAMDRPGMGWAARTVRAQRFHWQGDGMPAFGRAVATGCWLQEPSGTAGGGPVASHVDGAQSNVEKAGAVADCEQ